MKLNLRNFVITNNLKRKMLKYDFSSGNVISKDLNVYEFFKNKKILLLYPYPSKERLNSELYDDILKKLKVAKEVEDNSKIFNKNITMHDKLEMMEIYRTKYINELDEIVGLSQMNEKKTEEFVVKSKVPDIWFLVDESNFINNHNKFDERYEVLIENLKILDYRPDPSLGQNIYLGIVFGYIMTIMLLIYFSGYAYILKNYVNLEKKNEMINKSL